MILNRNPENFFAETEQVAFRPSNVVTGIDFSDDPLLQGRLHAYQDTQLHRLGSPNFIHLPINKPICPFRNNNQDGVMQLNVMTSRVNYTPNSLGENLPNRATVNQGAFLHFEEKVEGAKSQHRSPGFADHFSQATFLWNSLSTVERHHLVEAAQFELAKAKDKGVQKRMLENFNAVDRKLAELVAEGLGIPFPALSLLPNHGRRSQALSQQQTARSTIGRKVAVLVAHGVESKQVSKVTQSLQDFGICAEIVSKMGGTVKTSDSLNVRSKRDLEVDRTFATTDSVLFDAVYIPGGAKSIAALKQNREALNFISDAFHHCKPLAASCEGIDLLAKLHLNLKISGSENGSGKINGEQGVVTQSDSAKMEQFIDDFILAIKEHRFWNRAQTG